MLLNPFTLHQPKTIVELTETFGRLGGKARLLSGGTFLLNNLKAAKRRDRSTPKHIISLQHIKGVFRLACDQPFPIDPRNAFPYRIHDVE